MRVSIKLRAVCALLALVLLAVPVMAQGSTEGGASSGPVEIKIATWTANTDQIALLQSFVDEFAEKEGIEIQAQFESIDFGEYNTKLSLELQGSEAPDVFWVLETSAPAFIQSGLLAELDEALAEYNPDDFSLNPRPVTERTPHIHDIVLRRIKARGCKSMIGFIAGLPESRADGIIIEDSSFSLASSGLESSAAAEMYSGLPEYDFRGVRIRHGKLVIRNTEIDLPEDERILIEDGGSAVFY